MTKLEFDLMCMEDDKHKAIATLTALDHDLDFDRRNLAAGLSYDLDTLDVETLKTLLLNAFDDLSDVLKRVHKAAEEVAAL